MKGKKIGILIGVSAVVVAVGASVTVTQQNEYKLIRQFGKVDRVISSSGISFKIPFIESTQSLPKETLLYDLAASDVITKDKKTMISDYIICTFRKTTKNQQFPELHILYIVTRKC